MVGKVVEVAAVYKMVLDLLDNFHKHSVEVEVLAVVACK